MTNYIRVSNSDKTITWEKKLTSGECLQIKGYLEGRQAVRIIPAVFKPVRTNSLKNFAKDFFLPTVVNHALKVNSTVGRAFAILAGLTLDILSFPIRLIRCVPRMIENYRREESLLRKFLIDQGVDSKLTTCEHVHVRFAWEEPSSVPTTIWTDANGVKHHNYAPEKHWIEKNVNFIEVPTYDGWFDQKSGRIS